MKATFCHNCGAKLAVISKFCSSCGTSLSSLANRPEPPPQQQAPAPAHQPQASFAPFVANQEDEDGYNKYDHMDHLNLRIDNFEIKFVKPVHQVETYGQLLAQGPAPIEKRDTPYANVSKEKFLKEFSQEAGGPAKSNET